MDGMHFAQSMKLVVRMCEQLKVPALATKVLKYLQDKETKDMFTQQMEKTEKAGTISTNLQDRRVAAPEVGFSLKNKQSTEVDSLKIVNNPELNSLLVKRPSQHAEEPEVTKKRKLF
jgi:hypothetical protein